MNAGSSVEAGRGRRLALSLTTRTEVCTRWLFFHKFRCTSWVVSYVSGGEKRRGRRRTFCISSRVSSTFWAYSLQRTMDMEHNYEGWVRVDHKNGVSWVGKGRKEV